MSFDSAHAAQGAIAVASGRHFPSGHFTDVTAAQAMKLTSAKTLEGQNLEISVRNGAVYVNTAKVVKADVMATNGVIHVVNAVLLPPAM